jgi:hypothetical protein
MLIKTSTNTARWLHYYIAEPFCEGAERISKAWQGVNFHALIEEKISLKNRVKLWIEGTILMTPYVNFIFWILYQNFSQPNRLSTSFSPEKLENFYSTCKTEAK